MTLVSRVLGFVRDAVIAAVFGAGAATDAFFVAFRIPNLLRRLFAEGAFSQAFVPLLSEYKNKNGDAETKELVDQAATFLVWSTMLVSVIGIIAAPVLIYWLVDPASQTPDSTAAAIWMTRFMFPYIVCMSFVALAGGVLNTWRQFKIPAFTPVLLNVCFILCALFLAPHLQQPVLALAWAVFLGGIAQLLFQIPFIINFFASIKWGKVVDRNPWEATTLEWSAPSPPGHGNFLTEPIVYRGPYEYSVPGAKSDFTPQFEPEKA